MKSSNNALHNLSGWEVKEISRIKVKRMHSSRIRTVCYRGHLGEGVVCPGESEVMRGPGSIPTGGNIYHWDFLFSSSNVSDANIGIVANFVGLITKLSY